MNPTCIYIFIFPVMFPRRYETNTRERQKQRENLGTSTGRASTGEAVRAGYSSTSLSQPGTSKKEMASSKLSSLAFYCTLYFMSCYLFLIFLLIKTNLIFSNSSSYQSLHPISLSDFILSSSHSLCPIIYFLNIYHFQLLTFSPLLKQILSFGSVQSYTPLPNNGQYDNFTLVLRNIFLF